MAEKRVVLDTNIFISAYIFPGSLISELFERIISGEFLLGVSEEILSEFERVITGKFMLSESIASEYVDVIRKNSMPVKPSCKIDVLKDEADNRIIECAAEFRADYIISGDKHLLELKKYKDIKIIKASAFARMFF